MWQGVQTLKVNWYTTERLKWCKTATMTVWQSPLIPLGYFLVWRASPFPLIAQHRVRERVWYNYYITAIRGIQAGPRLDTSRRNPIILESQCRSYLLSKQKFTNKDMKKGSFV